jgi:methionyl-tRNA formyltransferase
MSLGGDLVIETVDHIIAGDIKTVRQEDIAIEGDLRPAPKIFKETCRIDWNAPVEKINNLVPRPLTLSRCVEQSDISFGRDTADEDL